MTKRQRWTDGRKAVSSSMFHRLAVRGHVWERQLSSSTSNEAPVPVDPLHEAVVRRHIKFSCSSPSVALGNAQSVPGAVSLPSAVHAVRPEVSSSSVHTYQWCASSVSAPSVQCPDMFEWLYLRTHVTVLLCRTPHGRHWYGTDTSLIRNWHVTDTELTRHWYGTDTALMSVNRPLFGLYCFPGIWTTRDTNWGELTESYRGSLLFGIWIRWRTTARWDYRIPCLEIC
jgi:hypothetical protein